MSMRISVQQLNGETFELEITPEMNMRAVKEQLKRMHTWEDELSRDTTVVELILGDKKVMNDETVAELGLAEGSKLTAVFKQNVARCSNQSAFGPDLDPDALVILEIPDSETEIGENAFLRCKQVAKVIIPGSVRLIGLSAFRACNKLRSVTIPDSVKQIEDLSFCGCTSLTSVSMPDSVTYLGDHAFTGCCALVSVRIPSSVTRIQEFTFNGCSSLVTVNIPESVTQIGEGAFRDCSSLKEVTMPDRVHIEPMAFADCPRLAPRASGQLL